MPLVDLINAPDHKTGDNVHFAPAENVTLSATKRGRSTRSGSSASLQLVCTAMNAITKGDELYRRYHDAYMAVSAAEYFAIYGWLPAYLASSEPRVSEAIANATVLAEEDLLACKQAKVGSEYVHPSTWPSPASYCAEILRVLGGWQPHGRARKRRVRHSAIKEELRR